MALTAITEEIGKELERARAANLAVKTKSPESSPSLEIDSFTPSAASGTVIESEDVHIVEATQLVTEVVSQKNSESATVTKEASVRTNGAKAANEDKPAMKVNGTGDEVGSADWGGLSASTLKRKTVKELVGYLAEKVCTNSE